MSKHNSTKRELPIVQCIFCGNKYPTSEEHIIPAWIYKFLDKSEIYYDKYTKVWHKLPNGESSASINLKSNDATTSILCSNCNCSWSKNIQEKAAPYLKPLILGKPLILTHKGITKIIRWYTCYLMIREMLHDHHDTYTQIERERFRKGDGKIPSALNVWINTIKSPNVETNHSLLKEPYIYIPTVKMHLAVTIIGHLLIISLGSTPDGLRGKNSSDYLKLRQLLEEWGFVQLLAFNSEYFNIKEITTTSALDTIKAIDLSDNIRKHLNWEYSK